jgi:hypothetical protein
MTTSKREREIAVTINKKKISFIERLTKSVRAVSKSFRTTSAEIERFNEACRKLDLK